MRKRYLKKLVSSLLVVSMFVSSINIVGATEKETKGEDIKTEVQSPINTGDITIPTGNKTGYVDAGIKYDRIPDYVALDNDGYNKATVIPSSYSSVDKGYVTSIKNQNPWGTCWAFAAVAAMESYALSHGLVKNPSDINLSEFALAYLTFDDKEMLRNETGDYSYIDDMDIGFDAGGNDEMAYKALSNGLALYNDDEVQYKQAQNDWTVPEIEWNEDNISYVLTGQKYINMSDRDQVKAAVIENGAVTTAYYSYDGFMNSNHLYNYNYFHSSTNHAVAIVGWDDNKSRDLFAVSDGTNTYKPQNNGAWLIKNSWGTGYGDKGYIWISYEDYGILASDAVVYEIAPKEKYENLYQHDGATIAYYYASGYSFASVYEVKEEKEIVNALSFNTYSTQMGYTAYLYDNSNGSKLDEGELIATASGMTTYAGYYTVDFDTDYMFMKGDKFTVIVKFASLGTMLYAWDEQDLAYEGMAYSTCKEGQSYIQKSPIGEMTDVVELGTYQNISLKAHSIQVKDKNTPSKISDAKVTGDEQVTISWKPVENAVSYELWKGDSESGNQYKVITGITGTTYVDSTKTGSSNPMDLVNFGDTYYYKVRAVYGDGTKNGYSEVKKVEVVPEKVVTKLSVENNKLKIAWNKLSYADGYNIYIGIDSKVDLVKIAEVGSSTTSYTYNGQLGYFTNYYVVVEPYVVNSKGTKISGKYVIDYIQTELSDARMVEEHYTIEGSMYFQWELYGGNLYEGISIYIYCNGLFSFGDFIETTDTSYVLDISRFKPGDILSIQCSTFYKFDSGAYVTSTFHTEEYEVCNVFDGEVNWYVKNDQIYVSMPNATDSKYIIYYGYDEDKAGFTGSAEVTKAEITAGYPLPVAQCPISGCKIGVVAVEKNQVVPKDLISVGGAYKEPQIKVIPDARATSSTIGVTLQATITNPMPNFGYQYQWYVSDTKTGTATAISGATSNKYVAYVGDSEAKYYYCKITCTYNSQHIYKTVNENGERTGVLGKSYYGKLTCSLVKNHTYTGSAITPEITVKEDDIKLIQGTHYTVSYKNNINAGTATFTLTFIGAYSSVGTYTNEFYINPASISGFTVGTIYDQMYTGSAIKPQVTVKKGSTALVAGTDYTVTYSNNTGIGTATVVIQGIGNYKDTITKTFKIVTIPASLLSVGSISAQTYTGQAVTPAVVVKYGNVTLVKGTDYDVTYSNNVKAGTATAIITLKGVYTGQLTQEFGILRKSVGECTISTIQDCTYTGSAITPTVTVKDGNVTLTLGVDYTVSYSSNTKVGIAMATVTGKGNYTGQSIKGFNIVPKSCAGFTVNSISPCTYLGLYIAPSVIVKNGNVILAEGTDYSVSYANNLNVGTANVTITFKGNYKGTLTTTFEIKPKGLDNVNIGDSVMELKYTGSALTPTVTVKDGSYTMVNGKDYTLAYSNNINVGMAKITVTGKGNYSGEKIFIFYIVESGPNKITSSSVVVSEQSSFISKLTSGITASGLLSKLNEGKSVAIYKGNTKVENTSLVGTGMLACIMEGTKILKKYTVIITGDTSGDGKTNITDMIAVKAHILKKTLLSGVYEKAGDVNGDGKINITDFIKIKASLLGKDSISGVAVK